jgi:hypothetical protein
MRRRLRELATFEERIAEIVMGVEVVGIEHDRPRVMGNGNLRCDR